MYTVGTLFSGLEIPGLAAAIIGDDVLFHVEIEDYPRKVLERHADRYWPNATLFADVRTVGRHNLPRVDILVGGFPCQDVSFAGRRAGMGEGTRSGLWSEFARIIHEIEPRVVLIENVPGVLAPVKARKACFTPDAATWFVRRAFVTRTVAPPPAFQVITQLRQMGYVVRTGLISAEDAGGSHKRDRWWCVASRDTQLADADQLRLYGQGKPARRTEAGVDAPRHPFVADPGSDDGERRTQVSEKRWANTGVSRRETPVGHAHITRMEGRTKARNTGSGRAHGKQHALRPGARATGGSTQSRLGRDAHGPACGLDFIGRRPAGPGEPQHAWEPPRVIAGGMPHRAARLKALGNSMYFPVALALMSNIRLWLQSQDSIALDEAA